MDEDSYLATMIAQCAAVGCALTLAQAGEVLKYVTAVLEANRTTNLTRISGLESALRLHAVDSLAAAHELSAAPMGKLLDVGSGGGFPGVPLAIQSRRPTVLLDSVAKKMLAVQLIMDGLFSGGRMRTEGLRVETHARICPAAYAGVVARAVAPLPSLVELASPLLTPGGLFIAMKGRPSEEELDAGRKAATIVGLEEVSIRAFELPDGGEARTIVCYRRTGEPTLRLPRRIGLAQHHPLA